MEIRENVELRPYTTFGIGGPTRYFIDVQNISDLNEALSFAESKDLEIFAIGGGSNLLVHDRGFSGVVIHLVNRGLEFERKGDQVVVEIGAGENWDKAVALTVQEGLWGLENLSYIPGTVGAAPVQNIGAYGRELDQVFHHLIAFDIKEKKLVTFKKAECGFGYRTSRFKKEEEINRFIIWKVGFVLEKNGKPNLEYADFRNYFSDDEVPSLSEIRRVVIEIRKNKLPDPSKIGNAGSFFKNLQLSEAEYEKLKENIQKNKPEALEKLEEIRSRFETGVGIKIPTAFLIDTVCEKKGYQRGGVMVSEKQALVLINHSGRATAKDVMEIVKEIREDVYNKTGFWITNEPDLLGFTFEEIEENFGVKS